LYRSCGNCEGGWPWEHLAGRASRLGRPRFHRSHKGVRSRCSVFFVVGLWAGATTPDPAWPLPRPATTPNRTVDLAACCGVIASSCFGPNCRLTRAVQSRGRSIGQGVKVGGAQARFQERLLTPFFHPWLKVSTFYYSWFDLQTVYPRLGIWSRPRGGAWWG
jgi:hypothetical protein